MYGTITSINDVKPYCNICLASKGHYTKDHEDWAKIKVDDFEEDIIKRHNDWVRQQNRPISVSEGQKKLIELAMQKVDEAIDNTYKDLDMGKTIPIFIQRLKEKLGLMKE